MSKHRGEKTYEQEFAEARAAMKRWVIHSLESSKERLEELGRIADKYGLDDYEKHSVHLVREGVKETEKLAKKIDTMRLDEMKEFLSNHKRR